MSLKAYKIDLSGFTGKVREVVSEAVQKKAFELGYDNGVYLCPLRHPYLFVPGGDGLGFTADSYFFEGHENQEITAADFLALESAKDEPEFKAQDPVLGRDANDCVWRYDIFSHKENNAEFPLVCVGSRWKQCIPYNGNEHLVGKKEKA